MKRGLGAIAAAIAVSACGGDDVTLAPSMPIPHGAPRDATTQPADDAGAEPYDATVGEGSTGPLDAGPCRRLETDADTDPDADADADADSDAACAHRILGRVDWNMAPSLTFGGPTPGALAVGHAGRFDGPPRDPSGRAGACFLATHPGGVYLGGEDAWAELGPIDLGAAAGCGVTLHAWVWYELEDSRSAANLAAVGDAGTETLNLGFADTPALFDVDAFSSIDCTVSPCPVLGQSVWSSYAPGSTTWRQARLDLSAFAGRRDLRLRLQFHSDVGPGFQGFYLSDLTVTSP